tara:strand:+ start:2001 stop:2801 length:801 start_codon:yes stop_codon:yes gene_type:complete
MIDAGVHFGHQTKYWNPKMKPFIYTTYKKLHIINLEKSVERFNKALEFIAKISKNNSKILFVGTKRAAKELVKKHAIDCDMPYVNNRWLGGTLTNFNTVKKSIEKLENLNSDIKSNISGDSMTKKETLVMKKQITKLDKNLSGIKDLTKLPDALFIVDTGYERIAIQEANKLNIPVIAIVDSNNSFDGVDHMIPGNDDSMSSINLFLAEVTKTIKDNKVKNDENGSRNFSDKPSKSKTLKKKQVINVEKNKKNLDEERKAHVQDED